MNSSSPPRENLRQALCNSRMLICLVAGFTSGLPFFLLVNLVPAWLHSEGVNLKIISFTTLFMMPFTLKFLWAPLADRFAINSLGRRRTWMLLPQMGLILAIAAMGMLQPRNDTGWMQLLYLLIAWLGASQDMSIDALRRDILPDAELGLGASVHVNAYKLASLVPGSLALILADHMPWQWVFPITALFLIPGMLMSLIIREPVSSGRHPPTLWQATVEPFMEFFNRRGGRYAALALSFMILYKLGDSMATTLATPFYLKLGYSRTEVGIVAKHAGLWASIAGGLLGGLWMVRLGINRALWVFGILQAVAILGFAWLTEADKSWLSLGLVIAGEAFGVGLGTTAFVAFLARETNPAYTATQFALFTSFAALPRTVLASTTGWLVNALGWQSFFLLCVLLSLPGFWLLAKVAPWSEKESA